ncbi:MAG: HAMP domain-containing protein [Candidatus Riflebacteria bacterium]|nr:HAMP domain-containing protein [Candidatus Riflebacteria bacterium]
MSERIRNLILVLLLLIPIISANFGYQEVTAIFTWWENLDQERFANQKLGEISVQTDIAQHISAYSASFKEKLASLLDQYSHKNPDSLPISSVSAANFKSPFPKYELLVFARPAAKQPASLIFTNENLSGRRSIEMMFNYLIAEHLKEPLKDHESKRNEKMLHQTFGSNCIGSVIANSQRSVATPIIYKNTPSFLVWDYAADENGKALGYFLIIRRNQDLQKCALKLCADKTGIGEHYAGGFISIFSESDDHLFPEQLSGAKFFQDWRQSIGTADKNLQQWEKDGFPWALPLGHHRLYTRMLAHEEHLAFLVLPDLTHTTLPYWLKTANFLATVLILLLLLRGLLFNIWPFATINSRFMAAFLLATTLPVALYITSATAYIFERGNADENQIEESLTTCLIDFDAGKEYLENAYTDLFSQYMSDQKIKNLLETRGLEAADAVFCRINELAAACPERVPISGIALYDLAGEARFHAQGNILKDDFVKLAGFYGTPFTTNLRKFVKQQEPDLVLPEQKEEVGAQAAMQSFKRSENGLEYEIERFRYRVTKTSVGRDQLEYIYDYITINGKNRFTLMIAWLNSDINQIVLRQNAIKLGLSSPHIQIAGFKQSAGGLESILNADRSISQQQHKQYAQIAKSAFSLKSGMVKSLLKNRSVVAYASHNFKNTILIASTDHTQKNHAHTLRLLAFASLGLFGMSILVLSGLITYIRVVRPLEIVKSSLDQIDQGYFPQISESPRKDEIGLLNNEFAMMVKGLEERQRLASMLSEQALSAISNSSDGTMLRSEKLHGVVLISDIRDFTPMCEKYEPKSVTQLLNIHFAEMAAVITSFGGKIYKFIGDAIEAVFIDEPGRSQSAALRAALAASAMLLRLQRINDQRQADGRFSYRIGIGLADGDLIAGEVGSKESRLDYAMFGNAFKNAEKLEALTKRFPDYPLLVDQKIAAATEGNLLNWQEETIDGEVVFRTQLPGESLIKRIHREETLLYTGKKDEEHKENLIEETWFGRNAAACRKFAFVAGSICILFPALAILLTIHTNNRAARDSAAKAVISRCESTRAKLQVADLEPVLLEQLLDDLCEGSSKTMTWNSNGISAEELKTNTDRIKKQLNEAGLEQTVYAVMHKPGNNLAAKPNNDWRLISYQGNPDFEKYYSELLLKLTECNFTWGWPSIADVKDKMPLILGSNMSIGHIHQDMHARVVQIKRGGDDEYFYWQPLFIRNLKKLAQFKNPPRLDLRYKESEDYIVNVGAILCILDRKTVQENHLVALKNLLKQEQVSYAIVSENNKKIAETTPFTDLKPEFNVSLPKIENWHVISLPVELGQQKYRVYLGKKLPSSQISWSQMLAGILIPILALVVIKAWKKAIYLERGIARKFSWQLWLGLFAAAIVPLTSVYTVNEWFAIGQRELRPVEERMRMLNNSERVEQRQFLQECINWHNINRLTNSAMLKNAVVKAGNMQNELQKTEFNNRLTEILQHFYDSGYRIRYNDFLVFSKLGWQHTYIPPTAVESEASEFRRFLNFFINSLFADLGMGNELATATNKSMGAGVKAELTTHAGLEVFRNLFGSDAYFALVNGVDLPIRIFIATGIGYLKILPAPTLTSPEIMVFWLFFDNLNSSMQRILGKISSKYSLFTESAVRYGSLKMPHVGSVDPASVYFARWSTAAKMPLSERTTYAGQECLVEVRLSRQNEVMTIIGFIPEQDYLNEIESTQRQFLGLLLLSIVAIILLTLFVSADITGPIIALTHAVKKIAAQQLDYRIRSKRNDELGQMQNTFNTIARGLQEKELMGQMVSTAAKHIASNAESLREAEAGTHLNVSVLYLAVPHFSIFMQTMNHQELIAEVREHIDFLCRIIINNGGEADKIMGEKILAWFYSPDGPEASAMMAAQAIRACRSSERAGELKFPITAGVHNGDIIAGLLGFGSQRDFTIIGDPVNTAARICSRAAELPGERFLASEAFSNLLPSGFARYYDFGNVELKGKSETINLKQIVF